jgi:hypothetical protein
MSGIHDLTTTQSSTTALPQQHAVPDAGCREYDRGCLPREISSDQVGLDELKGATRVAYERVTKIALSMISGAVGSPWAV